MIHVQSLIIEGFFLFTEILGGGFPLGSLVMVMEDAEAPHHMLLLRNFMSQGLVHKQPLLYASPSRDPRGFLGTLPSPGSFKDDKSQENDPNHVPYFVHCILLFIYYFLIVLWYYGFHVMSTIAG